MFLNPKSDKYEIVAFETEEKWLEHRKNGYGGSDVGTICGLNEYSSPNKLWRTLKGLEPKFEGNKFTKAGKLLEQSVAEYFSEDAECRVIDNEVFFCSDYFSVINNEFPYRLSTPDRMFFNSYKDDDGNIKTELCILECKTTQRVIDLDNFPESWIAQTQFYMGNMGIKKCAIAWLERGIDFKYKFFDFDEDFYNAICAEGDKFWKENVIGNKEPELTTAQDMIERYQQDNGKVLDADIDVYAEYKDLIKIKAKISELKKQEKALVGSLQVGMAGNQILKFENKIIATWKTAKPSTKFDTERFEFEYPELYKEFLIEKPGARKFLAKKIKD